MPEHLIYPLDHFAAEFARLHSIGVSAWADADVAVVGLARNCAPWLEGNLARLLQLVGDCKSWRLHIETNDNTDATDQVLVDFCSAFHQATFTSQRLGRQQFSAEFAGPRTVALAQYRTACQQWVRENAGLSDYTIVIDWDAWGGWSHAGVMHGVGLLETTTDAFGMTSVSLMQHGPSKSWLHYDAWALRLNSPWDDYTAGLGGWKHHWVPAVGSPPIPVCSAFGGLAIYRTGDYLAGTYDGVDCEHVPFHETISVRTGKRLYLDPAMRTVMYWSESDHGGRDGNH